VSDFLNTVLPAGGWFCAAIFEGDLRKQQFYSSHDELATGIDSAVDSGADIYFALASFDAKSRKAEHATHLRSVFVDLDCGEGKHYPDQAAASSALRAFIDSHNVPRPTYVVNSGGGLHAYWAFERDLEVSEWLPLARAFKTLCLANGLMIDPAVTADVARILRAPGTFNYKQSTAREVQILYRGKPVNVAAFEALLPPAPVDLSAARAYGMDQTTNDLARGDLDPCSFARIAKKSLKGAGGCRQIRHALESAATLEEPLWRAALSVAANCEDGTTAIHKLSKSHPGYSYEDTEEKAQRLLHKPYTCEWYKSNYAAGCAGCTHKIGSPIVLGRFVKEATPTEAGGYLIEAKLEDAVDASPLPVAMPALPHGYFRGASGGIYRRSSGPDGEPVAIEIYPYDLYVEERFYDTDEEGDGEGEQVTVCINLPQDGMRRFVAPLSSLMAPDAMRTILSKHGVIAYGKQVNLIMGYLASAIHKLQTSSVSHRTRSQMGWTPERHFVVGNLEYTPAGPKLAPPASTVRHMAPWFHSKGTVEGWRDVISTYNTEGFEPLAFAFLVGAGSVLLQLLDSPQVKGGVVHLVSNESGSGKTSAQMAINSIFGMPREMLLGRDDTANAKIQAMGMFNSICTTIDEITSMQPHEISDLVYNATNGRGKHRMEAQANKLRVNKATWSLFTVTSGNSVLSDMLLANKSAAEGELKRLVELRAYKPSDDLARSVVARFNALSHNYGVAGPIYIQHVVSNYDRVSAALKAAHEKVVVDYGFDRTDRFFTAQLACATMAGSIMSKLGLIDLDVQRIIRYGIEAVRGSKTTAEAVAGSPSTLALETLAAFIAENYNNTLIIKSEASGEAAITSPKGALRIRYEPDTQEMIIVAADLRKYFVERRVDMKASIQEFQACGALKIGKDGQPTIHRRPAAGAQNSSMRGTPTRCYVFDVAKLGLSSLMGDGS